MCLDQVSGDSQHPNLTINYSLPSFFVLVLISFDFAGHHFCLFWSTGFLCCEERSFEPSQRELVILEGGKKPTFILYSDCLWLVKWSIRGNSPVEENLLGSRYWTAKLWASQVTIGNINYALKIAKGFGGVKKATDHHWERLMALAKERKHFFSFLNEDKSCNDSNCPEVHICVWEREVPC